MANPALAITGSRTPTLPAIFSGYKARIGDALRLRLSGESLAASPLLLYSMGWADADGRAIVATEGKALRPTLCLFACEAAGGILDRAMPAAVSLELVHNFSLIHDDVQDRDETRHHRPTVWAVWGDAKALVAGNVMNVVADASLAELAQLGVSLQDANRVARLLTEAYLEMIEGQFLDLSYEGRSDVGMRAYLGMISKKTGALFRCALNVGALLGGGDTPTVRAFRECGRHLGFAFQVRDDVLGIWGDDDTTGKPVGADIRRKKNSLPVVYAMSKARGTDASVLESVYRSESIDDEAVDDVLGIMDCLSVKDYAEGLVAEHCDATLSSLDGVEMSPRDRQDVEELCHFLSVRQH